MLKIVLTLQSPGEVTVLDGSIGNISRLAAISDYEAWFEGTGTYHLSGYPRWNEPVRGLLARCIDLIDPAIELDSLPDDWISCRIDIGLNPGGRARTPTRIAMCRLVNQEDGMFVGWREGRLLGWTAVEQPILHSNTWQLARQGLAVSVWNSTQIPSVKPIQIQSYEGWDSGYIRSSELPEPLRTAFEQRHRMSGRPALSTDAYWRHDLTDFLGWSD